MPLLTDEQVLAHVDPAYWPRLSITCALNDVPEVKPVLEAFWEACRLFFPTVRIGGSHRQVVLGVAPFQLDLPHGSLKWEPNSNVYHIALETFIFIYAQKLLSVASNLRVACVLEEFVHSYMSVSDEDLTSKIVAAIYPGVRWEGGRYISV